MRDIQFIRDNTKVVEDDTKSRGVELNFEELLKLDDVRRQLTAQIDKLREERNQVAARAKGGKPSEEDIATGKGLKQRIAAIETELNQVQADLNTLLLSVPNTIHESVVRAPGEEGNQVVRTEGEKPSFDFEIKDHVTLGEDLGLIDLKTAAEVSGARFYYLKGDLVLLENAVTTWILHKLADKGFTPVITPTLVREEMMEATGFFPAERNEIYSVNPDEDNLYLIGTSEVPLTGLHQVHKLDAGELPKFYVGYSTCYRREAGSYGKDTHGIFRVHQFNKLEMYCFAHPDKSWEIHEQMLSIEEEILNELGLHYQVINIGSGDLGAPAAKKYDCEVWIPSQQKYRELTSCSNCTDYQARRMNIKFEDESGEKHLVHTLNGTAMASTRTLIAIMENYQTVDGHIRIPEVLRPFMNGREQI